MTIETEGIFIDIHIAVEASTICDVDYLQSSSEHLCHNYEVFNKMQGIFLTTTMH
ncbi:hypothetical protein GIB67_030374 [Kingdonia uniflora]|uniref:Uncharacterized protein n=1 Tax=Kingdonia uniflora TaxID=39325 RepID=A0A7J7M6S4_9MAGN|nr:hypothetical protein GIB67_030374 [Kingdonia uniflora]